VLIATANPNPNLTVLTYMTGDSVHLEVVITRIRRGPGRF